jgi:hypothetical protein
MKLSDDEIENIALAIAEFHGDMTDPDWHEGMEYMLWLEPADHAEIARRAAAIKADHDRA